MRVTTDDLGRYGLTVFTGGRGADRYRRMADLAGRAEAAGFGAVWTGELYNRSATVPMAVLSDAPRSSGPWRPATSTS